MDITESYITCCKQVAQTLGRDVDSVQAWSPSTSCIPPVLDRSPFQQAAIRLHGHILSSIQFIKEHSRDLVQVGRVSAHDRAQIEADMLKLLRGCETGLQELQNAVKSSKPAKGGPSATQVAHCHGLVLTLHAVLQGAVSAMNRVRAAATASAAPSTPSAATPSMAEALVNARRTASSSTPSQLPPSPRNSSAGAITPPTIPVRPPTTSAAVPNGSAPHSRLPVRPPMITPPRPPLLSPGPPPLPGRSVPPVGSPSKLSPKPLKDAQISSISPLQKDSYKLPSPDTNHSTGNHGHQQQQQQQQQIQQEPVNSAHFALMEDLSQRYEQTKNIEQQLHQVAEMNRTMATELSSQMEMAEQMYTDALFATNNLERGNFQLGKAAKVKKDSGCTSFIVLVSAAILLLLVDYVYPG